MKSVVKWDIFLRSKQRYPDDNSNYVDDTTFQKLAALYPEGVREYPGGPVFECDLAEDDPKLEQLLEEMRLLGLTAVSGKLRKAKPGEFTVRIEREYEKSDYDTAEYVDPNPTVAFAPVDDRTIDGRLLIRTRNAKPRGPIGFTFSAIIVSDEGREVLEKASLRHLAFKPIVVGDDDESPTTLFQGHWELTSDLRLPPLNQRFIKVLNNKGEPFNGDYTQGCHLFEGLYHIPELHYRRTEIKALEPFDLALTCERFGNVEHVAYPSTIASHHFYEVCTRAKFKMDWAPVRLDEE